MSAPGTARYKPLGGRSASALLERAAASARSRASAAEARPEDGGGEGGGGGGGRGASARGTPAASSPGGGAPRHHGKHHRKHAGEVAPGYTLDGVAALVLRVVQQKVGKDSDMCRHSTRARPSCRAVCARG
jgi:hypothetical protein